MVTVRPPSDAAHRNRAPLGTDLANGENISGDVAAAAAGRRRSARKVGVRSIERDGVEVTASMEAGAPCEATQVPNRRGAREVRSCAFGCVVKRVQIRK
ncbi:hypothetical protein N9L76_06710 [bacterium]|nr:hypothetical protein [bacterium]